MRVLKRKGGEGERETDGRGTHQQPKCCRHRRHALLQRALFCSHSCSFFLSLFQHCVQFSWKYQHPLLPSPAERDGHNKREGRRDQKRDGRTEHTEGRKDLSACVCVCVCVRLCLVGGICVSGTINCITYVLHVYVVNTCKLIYILLQRAQRRGRRANTQRYKRKDTNTSTICD